MTEVSYSIDEASLAAKAARAKVAKLHGHHQILRYRIDIQATTRARTELGLAYGELLDAIIDLAKAMDSRGPEWAARVCETGWRLFNQSDSGHEDCDQAWAAYQAARRSGSWAAVVEARTAYRYSLVSWHMTQHIRRGQEDEHLRDQLSRRLDDSMRLGPADFFSQLPSPAQELAQQARVRERAASLRRDATRYDQGRLPGWQPAR